MTTYRCECGAGYYVHGVKTEGESICDECGSEMALVTP